MTTLFENWCRANAKIISIEQFKELSGYDFFEFYKRNRRYCLSAWNIWHYNQTHPQLPKRKGVPQYLVWKKEKTKNRLREIEKKIKQYS